MIHYPARTTSPFCVPVSHPNVCVLLIEGMPVLTVGLTTVGLTTVGLTTVAPPTDVDECPDASKQVLPVRHRFQVLGIHASRIAAQMVEF